jgi:hypothetical protein
MLHRAVRVAHTTFSRFNDVFCCDLITFLSLVYAEKLQQKANNRAKRSSSVPAPVRKIAAAAAAKPRKSVGAPGPDSNHSSSGSSNGRNVWTPSEVMALYNIHAKVPPQTAHLWDVISESLLEEQGIDRSAKECMDRWFVVSTVYSSSFHSSFYSCSAFSYIRS